MFQDLGKPGGHIGVFQPRREKFVQALVCIGSLGFGAGQDTLEGFDGLLPQKFY